MNLTANLIPRRLVLLVLALFLIDRPTKALAAADAPASPPAAGAAVTVADDPDTVTLDNGILTVKVRKQNGDLISMRYRGLDMLSRGGAYWNVYGSKPGEKPTQNKGHPATYTVTKDPAKNGGSVGEIVLGFPFKGEADVEPLDLEIRYTLNRGDSGIYGSETLVHKAGYPAFNDGVNTVCWKLNPDVFDFLSAGDEKQRHMVSPEDWVKGTQLNLWEAPPDEHGHPQG